MTRYHVLVSDGLTADPDLQMPEGFRFIEPSAPGPGGDMRWWLCEDDNAPAALEQHRVEPVFMRVDGKPVITERHIVNEHGMRVRDGDSDG